MTWREIFARAWLVLRSRVAKHRVCKCGLPKDRVAVDVIGGTMIYQWRCEECDAVEAKRKFDEQTRKHAWPGCDWIRVEPGAPIRIPARAQVVTRDGYAYVPETVFDNR